MGRHPGRLELAKDLRRDRCSERTR
jgi:hypothetical protein